MKRTPIRRTTPLRRSSRLAPRNAKRKWLLYVKQFHSPDRVEWVNARGCCVPGCRGKNVQNSHIKSRGAGGTYRDIVPHCFAHHTEWHQHGAITFGGVEYPRDYFKIEATLVQVAWFKFCALAGIEA